MAVKIRLQRAGMPKQPNYRIVVIESRNQRDGAAIANLGQYAPYKSNKPLLIDLDLYQEWVAKGAVPTEVVKKLVRQFRKRGETIKAAVEAPKAKPEPKAKAAEVAVETEVKPESVTGGPEGT